MEGDLHAGRDVDHAPDRDHRFGIRGGADRHRPAPSFRTETHEVEDLGRHDDAPRGNADASAKGLQGAAVAGLGHDRHEPGRRVLAFGVQRTLARDRGIRPLRGVRGRTLGARWPAAGAEIVDLTLLADDDPGPEAAEHQHERREEDERRAVAAWLRSVTGPERAGDLVRAPPCPPRRGLLDPRLDCFDRDGFLDLVPGQEAQPWALAAEPDLVVRLQSDAADPPSVDVGPVQAPHVIEDGGRVLDADLAVSMRDGAFALGIEGAVVVAASSDAHPFGLELLHVPSAAAGEVEKPEGQAGLDAAVRFVDHPHGAHRDGFPVPGTPLSVRAS